MEKNRSRSVGAWVLFTGVFFFLLMGAGAWAQDIKIGGDPAFERPHGAPRQVQPGGVGSRQAGAEFQGRGSREEGGVRHRRRAGRQGRRGCGREALHRGQGQDHHRDLFQLPLLRGDQRGRQIRRGLLGAGGHLRRHHPARVSNTSSAPARRLPCTATRPCSVWPNTWPRKWERSPTR